MLFGVEKSLNIGGCIWDWLTPEVLELVAEFIDLWGATIHCLGASFSSISDHPLPCEAFSWSTIVGQKTLDDRGWFFGVRKRSSYWEILRDLEGSDQHVVLQLVLYQYWHSIPFLGLTLSEDSLRSSPSPWLKSLSIWRSWRDPQSH